MFWQSALQREEEWLGPTPLWNPSLTPGGDLLLRLGKKNLPWHTTRFPVLVKTILSLQPPPPFLSAGFNESRASRDCLRGDKSKTDRHTYPVLTPHMVPSSFFLHFFLSISFLREIRVVWEWKRRPKETWAFFGDVDDSVLGAISFTLRKFTISYHVGNVTPKIPQL